MNLLTGGSGTLGRELRKIVDFVSIPDRAQLDITQLIQIVPAGLKLIVHCAAYTDLVKAEQEKELCYQTNVIGTRNLASLGIPMLYISTSYVFDGERGNYNEEDYPNPINFYSLTKLLGEYESRRTRSVVVRCLFKLKPFEHEFACTNQYTSGTYAPEMAKEIAKVVRLFEKLPPTIHVGENRKSTFDLARETKPNVKPITREQIKGVKLPFDTSLVCSKWEAIKKQYENP